MRTEVNCGCQGRGSDLGVFLTGRSAARIRTWTIGTKSLRFVLLTMESCMALDIAVSTQVHSGARGDGAIDVDRGCQPGHLPSGDAVRVLGFLTIIRSARRRYRRLAVVGVTVGFVRGVTARAAAAHLPATQGAMGSVLDNPWSDHLANVPDRWTRRQPLAPLRP